MAYVETRHQSWGGRLMESIKSVLIGALLFVVSFPLLFWNEGRAIHTARALAEGAAAVITVPADKVDPANEHKLVAMSAEAKTSETVTDPQFAVAQTAIALVRDVEMYQWKEIKEEHTTKNTGGSTDTTITYDYKQEWADDVIDSSDFHVGGYDNPKRMEFEPEHFQAKNVTVGAFQLPQDMVSKIDQDESLPVADSDLARLPGSLKHRAKLADSGFYIGLDPANPQVGDLRVHFKVVKPGMVSLIAQQVGASFAPYQTKAGKALSILYVGQKTAQEMFAQEEANNVALTWMLRFLGFILMTVGLAMTFRPMVVFADVLPFMGSMLGMGIAFFAALAGFGLSFITIAIGWVFYRPLIGIPLLLLGIGSIVLLVVVTRGRKKPAAAGGVAPA